MSTQLVIMSGGGGGGSGGNGEAAAPAAAGAELEERSLRGNSKPSEWAYRYAESHYQAHSTDC